MPASISSIAAREGIFVVIEAALPGRPIAPVGVVLIDPARNRGFVRFRHDFAALAEPEDAEVLEALEEDAGRKISSQGAEAFVAGLEDSLSNALRVSGRQIVAVDAFTRVLERLYHEHVEPVPVRKFETHVPLYSLRAAAGGLGEEMESQAEDWIPVPAGARASADVFAARVVGRSMEPLISDGSLNLFRFHPHGSRQGKILLIERFGSLDDAARYTVKRYTSTKIQTGEDSWAHGQIRLVPVNPEFSPWDVGPEDFAVVAEWLRVIE